MHYIRRKHHRKLAELFMKKKREGVILAGMVGCGKTTLAEEVLTSLSKEFHIFKFSGDDVIFRNAVRQDTTYIEKSIRSQTRGKALCFVDEVQKSEYIFDALKVAFDQSDVSFIISGSNPDYLNTIAKKRLQRRAHHFILNPFSLPELLADFGFFKLHDAHVFQDILLAPTTSSVEKSLGFVIGKADLPKIISRFMIYGGLPLVHALGSNDGSEMLMEIRKVVERGFESLSVGNNRQADMITTELAHLHAREFTYQNIFQKTGQRRRDVINMTIDQLINQGYLIQKKPYLDDIQRRSYLSVYSFTDPGIVSYLTGMTNLDKVSGQRVEGYVHTQLQNIIQNDIAPKSSLSYFKPYTVDVNKKIKYKPGEIDFIFKCGDILRPIEVKAGYNMANMDVSALETFVSQHKLPFGIVLYGGLPYWNKKISKILYWPFWLI